MLSQRSSAELEYVNRALECSKQYIQHNRLRTRGNGCTFDANVMEGKDRILPARRAQIGSCPAVAWSGLRQDYDGSRLRFPWAASLQRGSRSCGRTR